MTLGEFGASIRREIIRAALERSQSLFLDSLDEENGADAVRFDNVEEDLNIPYMNRDGVPLGMDIFKPIVPKGTELPVIVTVHGGGLTMGDRRISRPFCRILANRGYLVFSIEYRLAPQANVCMELDDVCAGLDLVGTRLVDFDVDFSRIFIAAESAGAYLAAYVTAMKGSEKLQEAIGYKPTRVSFKAIGLLSGMLYTRQKGPGNWILGDQIYGKKRADENFLQYMDPENPEIINNLPPAFLVTSKADFLNSYTFRMNEALKKAGKACHMVYYGDDELQHAFSTMQTDNPKSIDSIDRMLAWFEEQAKIAAERESNAAARAAQKEEMLAAMKDGSFDDRKVWNYVKARAEVEPDRMYLPAIMDCSRTYTYAQMFEKWDEYARVFSHLHMTGADHSRVAIVGTVSAEPLFAYYGLNMVGTAVSMFSYPDMLPGGRWKTMVQKEHITDMVVSDIMVSPQMWEELKKAKAEFGLKNIILLHSKMGGPCVGYAEMAFNEFNYNALRRLPDTVFMDDLIEQCKDTPIAYGEDSGDNIAVICHTSGTTNGTRKPLPYTDRMVNALCSAAPDGIPTGIPVGPKTGGPKRTVILASFDYSASSMINGSANMTFASGNTLATTFFGFLHPKFVRSFNYYGIDSIFTSGFMADKWMQMPDLPEDTFASLKVMGFGGSYLAPTKLDKYEGFLREHGFRGVCVQGYGMSEVAGGLFIVPPGCKDDIIGFPDNMENFRIFDETDGKFHRIAEGERDGILYGRSNSMCLNYLDGEKLFDLTDIDGLGYVSMNDVMHVNPNGSLSYVGRSNQYFANNEGVKFDAGLVEKQLSGHPNISLCAIVPVLDKRIHDTVPVLYAVPADKNADAVGQLRQALVDVFIKGDKLKGSILPTQLILVDDIPLSATGKIDVYHITRSRLVGDAWNIIPVKTGDEVTDIRCEKADQLNSYTGGTLPEGMGKDSAFNTFDIFSAPAGISKYKSAVKKSSAAIKDGRAALKKKISDIELPTPKMNINMHSMPRMPKMPKPIASVVDLFMILGADLEGSDQDIEE